MQNAVSKKVGVLALQGGFSAHINTLKILGVNAIEVKTPKELSLCCGLILPGGESTTINHLLERGDMRESLLDFASKKPLFGTCAGLIIMAQQGLFSLTIKRNAYGRQSASFSTNLKVHFPTGIRDCSALFIRAPEIISLNSLNTKILATYAHSPVFVQEGHHLGASFHPELTSDVSFHRYFLHLCGIETDTPSLEG